MSFSQDKHETLGLHEFSEGYTFNLPFGFRLPAGYKSFTHPANREARYIAHPSDIALVEKSGGTLNINEFQFPFFIFVIQNIGYFKEEGKFSFEGPDFKTKVEKSLKATNYRKFKLKDHMLLTYSHPDTEPKNLPASNILFMETKFDTIVLTIVFFDKEANSGTWRSFVDGLDSRPTPIVPSRSIVYELKPEFGESHIFNKDVHENFRANTACNDKLVIDKPNLDEKDFEVACPEERFVQLTFPTKQAINLSGKKQIIFDKFVHFRKLFFYNERVGKIQSSGTDRSIDQYFFFLKGKMVYGSQFNWSRASKKDPEPPISTITEHKIFKQYNAIRSEKYRKYYGIKP
jgi:hypothetical protein